MNIAGVRPPGADDSEEYGNHQNPPKSIKIIDFSSKSIEIHEIHGKIHQNASKSIDDSEEYGNDAKW